VSDNSAPTLSGVPSDTTASVTHPLSIETRARSVSLETAGWQARLNRKELLCLGLLLAATFVAYSPMLMSQFISYDDGSYILDSHLVRNLSFDNIKALFSSIVWNQYSQSSC
jgi:hypothetical protein